MASHEEIEFTTGRTDELGTWRWSDGHMPDSFLLLYPGNADPIDSDAVFMHKQSLKVRSIFEELRLPRVSVVWVDPETLNPEDPVNECFPIWLMDGPRYDRTPIGHGTLYGIALKLLTSLEFDGIPPVTLLDAWGEESDD